VVNAPFAGASRGSLIVWLTPGVVGTIATRLWVAYYRRRFAAPVSGSRQATTGTSPAAPLAAPYTLSRT
jgi:hypothetical protein